MKNTSFRFNRVCKFSGLILTVSALALLPACKSSTAQQSKKGPVDETGKTIASPSPSKTYELPAEIVNAELRTLDGKKVTLADYRGKVVLLNLWATWCGPCRMEIPELVKISEEMKDRGVAVVGMTRLDDDRGNSEDRVKSFVKEQQVSYDIILPTDNVAEEFSSMGDYSIPATFLINREGQLVKIFKGFNKVRTPQSVRQSLEAALEGQS